MRKLLLLCLIVIAISSCKQEREMVCMESLLEEMTNLSRLTLFSDDEYRSVQFSSYDRRSKTPENPDWFANDDGFGNETIPAFQEVLEEAGENGIGTYLICDIQQPGAIVRLWTAGIGGDIRLFIDDISEPVYEGKAIDFFWNTIEVLSDGKLKGEYTEVFRQYDAVYFPVPFAKRCRIEWIGNLKDTHFYHLGVRLYKEGTKVQSFRPENCSKYEKQLSGIATVFKGNQISRGFDNKDTYKMEALAPKNKKTELFKSSGSAAIREISLKVKASDYESVMRKNVLKIYFDQENDPEVEVPIGDFFAAAPGISPYYSLPMAIGLDSTLLCHFVMPYKKSVKIEIENFSEEDIYISASVKTVKNRWIEGKTMYFNAHWKIDYDLLAREIGIPDVMISDIHYLDFEGKGRIVGAAAFIYNPSNVPSSWGNWWGEGDEKIFVDQDTFPSFFGTGSEDYFNYSWSSSKLFSYPYCGQPRNDGPGNRGYVSNFRWHILDDIPFSEQIHFFMELGHHGQVPGFSYGRLIYYYALPGQQIERESLSKEDLRDIVYLPWHPEASKGSAGYSFIQAEEIITKRSTIRIETEQLSADGNLVMWHPSRKGEECSFILNSGKSDHKTKLGFTMLHGPGYGAFLVEINGEKRKLGGQEVLDLSTTMRKVMDNHFTDAFLLKKGDNTIIFINESEDSQLMLGIDFIWIPN